MEKSSLQKKSFFLQFSLYQNDIFVILFGNHLREENCLTIHDSLGHNKMIIPGVMMGGFVIEPSVKRKGSEIDIWNLDNRYMRS